MACCKCCCGGVDCTEGQQGKCCCGENCCSADQCCCDGECQDLPCVAYRFCIVNSNFIADNPWDVYLNGQLLGRYSGAANTNVCFSINLADINFDTDNEISFSLVSCNRDDYFEYQVQKSVCGGNYYSIFSSNSGFLNSSYFEDGTCDTQQFSSTFSVSPLP